MGRSWSGRRYCLKEEGLGLSSTVPQEMACVGGREDASAQEEMFLQEIGVPEGGGEVVDNDYLLPSLSYYPCPYPAFSQGSLDPC